MDLEKTFFENDIEMDVKFNKKIMSVYDLSYILIDFQAVINNLTEIIWESIRKKNEIIGEKPFSEPDYGSLIEKEQAFTPEIIVPEYQYLKWQRQRERNSISYAHKGEEANIYRPVRVGYKQTTSRRFNKKYQMNLKLKGFSEGSLFLNLVNSIIVSILTEFLKELVIKKTGNPNAININIFNNQYIQIDGEIVKSIPKDSCIRSAIELKQGSNKNQLDVNKCIHNVVESSMPDEDIEESVIRLLRELKKNGFVSEQITYDDRGIKTAVRDIERFTGNFMDIRI